MKKNIALSYTLFVLAGIILLLSGCSRDFLEVKPKGKVIASRIADYSGLFESAIFAQFNGGGISMDAQHILGDDVAGLEPHFNNPSYFGAEGTRRQRIFQYADDIYRSDEQTAEVSGLYSRIYTANKVIHEVMDAEDGSEQLKKQVRAEGYCHRAFSYFMLINYFGKPYAAATAATDPGVPLILQKDFDQSSFVRASVQEVYDAIITDLTAAIPDLPLVQNTANRFTKAAAEALLGKIYLFTGQAAKAVVQLDNAVAHLPAAFTVSGTVGLINYNTATPGSPVLGYAFMTPQIGSTASQGHGYPESLFAQAAIALWVGNAAALIIHPETRALYSAADLRLKLFVPTYAVTSPGPLPTLPPGLYRSRSGFLGNSIGIQLPDIYLLRAEAKARTNDLAAATENLLILRRNRMPEAAAAAGIPTTQDALIRFVIEERRREFATMGFRWFDMRRLSVDPLFAGATFRHELFDATGALKATFAFKPERFVLRFSEKLMQESYGLVNNP